MVNYFYLLFTKLQTHKMKFENIKTKHITPSKYLNEVEKDPKLNSTPSARTWEFAEEQLQCSPHDQPQTVNELDLQANVDGLDYL